MQSRRYWLQSGLAFSGASLLRATAWATQSGDAKVLIVFMRGAYDALSALPPMSNEFYYEARPKIAIPRPDETDVHAAVRLDADWSLHPALAEHLLPLWQAGQLAFVPFAGTDDASRSHFETQDSIEAGQPSDRPHDPNSGFLGRLADVLGQRARPVAFTQATPPSFRGASAPIANFSVNSIGLGGISPREQALIEAMYQTPQAAELAPFINVHDGFSIRSRAYEAVRQEMAAAGKDAVSPRGFAHQMQRVAVLMRDQYNLAFIDVGGWDTHINQGASEGELAAKFADFSAGLATFAQACGDDWCKTVVIVISEFGRTFHENGDHGTDHGHGTVYWMLGGGIKGQRIAGSQQRLAPDTLFQNRDLPVLTDYRALIGGVFARVYGLSAEQSERVFPGARPDAIDLI